MSLSHLFWGPVTACFGCSCNRRLIRRIEKACAYRQRSHYLGTPQLLPKCDSCVPPHFSISLRLAGRPDSRLNLAIAPTQ
jgi:hypothetical protein